jgi:hypothetical protein
MGEHPVIRLALRADRIDEERNACFGERADERVKWPGLGTVRIWRYDVPSPSFVRARNHQLIIRVPRCRRYVFAITYPAVLSARRLVSLRAARVRMDRRDRSIILSPDSPSAHLGKAGRPRATNFVRLSVAHTEPSAQTSNHKRALTTASHHR